VAVVEYKRPGRQHFKPVGALPELKSRMFPSALAALAYEETRDLISYRLTVAGGASNPF
jgi:hypothetical protein